MSDFKKHWGSSRQVEKAFGLEAPRTRQSLRVQDIENRAEYSFDCPIGTWRGKLDAKAWGKKSNILLYLTDTTSGEKFSLSLYWTNGYEPPNGGPDFKEEGEAGDIFELETAKTPKGYSKLLSARKLQPCNERPALD